MQIFVDLCAFPLMRSCFLGKEDNRLLLSQAHGKTSLNYLKTGLKGGQSSAKTRKNLQLGNYNKRKLQDGNLLDMEKRSRVLAFLKHSCTTI